ncbi:acyl-CoA dehydrogenase, partial [Haliangium sp. UPWRP_2]
MHIALAGVLGATARFVESSEPLWSQVEPQVAERWGRDRRLLGVAGR